MSRLSTDDHDSNAMEFGKDLQAPSVALVARDVSVTFTTTSKMGDSSKKRVINNLGGRSRRKVTRAVDNVSLIAHEGESIGIVGRNGGGKSTLLRAISGFDKRDSGEVYAASRPVFLGVSPALLPNRTGMENVRLGCLALGLTSDHLEESITAAVEMADLGDAIYDPINTYSSGMGARLRFSITASVPKTDILMIDEALGTGDAAFQERSESAIDRILRTAGTIFFVSHSTPQVRSMCSRVLWMHDGQIIMDADTESVLERYVLWSNRLKRKDFAATDSMIDEAKRAYRPPTLELSEARKR